MVLRPVLTPISTLQSPPAQSYAPAWEIVAGLQHQQAPGYWLIAQTDHARLAGELARSFRSPLLPPVSDDVIEAIAAHDAGWDGLERDNGKLTVAMSVDDKPASFLDATPEEFVQAWTGSIDHAAGLSSLGGVLVSNHFSRLCRHRLDSGGDSARDTALLEEFMQDEQRRQVTLLSEIRRRQGAPSDSEVETLVDLLQFCDLLSLYLCSGATDSVVFPQQFHGKTIRISRRENEFKLEPSLLAGNNSTAQASGSQTFEIPATSFSIRDKSQHSELLRFTVR